MAMPVVNIPAPRVRPAQDYSKLGQYLAMAINPEGYARAQALPEIYKQRALLQEKNKMQSALLNRLESGGNGPSGDYNIKFDEYGNIAGYSQKSLKEKAEDREYQEEIDWRNQQPIKSPPIVNQVGGGRGQATQPSQQGPPIQNLINAASGGGQSMVGQAPQVGGQPPTPPPNLSPADQRKFAAAIATKKAGVDIDIAKKGREKWSSEVADREIKFAVMSPKLNAFMDVGGRAYQELKDVAKQYGITLNFEKGGMNALFAMATKNVAMRLKLTPLMVALDRLRPELGTEMMRQLGAFRSATMAKRFEDTLAQFSGDIREDIANMSTTIVKNTANVILMDETGRQLSDSEKGIKMRGFEANLVRKYNYMYRKMGLMTKPYTAGRSFEWLAENSEFSPNEQAIINNAATDNPKYSRDEVIAKLIERGVF